MGKKRNRKGIKKVVQESQPPEDTLLGNDAKHRRILALVMWYLPVTDRLRRIFLNSKEATLMTWWDDERKVDDDKLNTRLIVVSGKGSIRSTKNSAMTQEIYGLA